MKFHWIIVLILFLPSGTAKAQEALNFTKGRVTIETTSSEILGNEIAKQYEELVETNENIKWSIEVPDNFNASSPPGILIHMTPRNLAKMPIGWGKAIEDRNLIWISLNKAGRLKQSKEMFIAVLATVFLDNNFPINTNRIYLVASSDSCQAASAAAQFYPTIFRGTIYSTCEPFNWKKDIPDTINIMRQNRFVFVASNEKIIRQAMRRAQRRYNDADILNTEYFYIPKLEYGKNIDRRRITEALTFLDG